jgi:hypothetical protein
MASRRRLHSDGFSFCGLQPLWAAFYADCYPSYCPLFVDSAPRIFSTPNGTAEAVNQNGSMNSANKPAHRGDIISLFATGEDQTTPAGVDGKLATVPLPRPKLPVSVTVGGQPVQVLYAGGAPGEVAGLMQVNVQIPPLMSFASSTPIQGGTASGGTVYAVPVTLTVGTVASPWLTSQFSNVTVQLRLSRTAAINSSPHAKYAGLLLTSPGRARCRSGI